MTIPRRRIDIDGLAFGLIDSPGPADAVAPTIVLVHGIGMSHRSLGRLHGVLADSARVVSIDMPGFAGLPKPRGDADIVRLGKGLADVVMTLGETRVVLVGHSMGAQWVIEAARHRPESVTAVVVIGAVADERHRTLPAQARALALDTIGETPSINTIVFTDYVRCGVPFYVAQLRHMLGYPTQLRLRELAVPVLVMRGGDDPVAGRAWCRRLRDAARVARLVEIPGHHHVVQHSAPNAVAAAILFHTETTWPDAAEMHAAAEGEGAPSTL